MLVHDDKQGDEDGHIHHKVNQRLGHHHPGRSLKNVMNKLIKKEVFEINHKKEASEKGIEKKEKASEEDLKKIDKASDEKQSEKKNEVSEKEKSCLLYTSPSPRD